MTDAPHEGETTMTKTYRVYFTGNDGNEHFWDQVASSKKRAAWLFNQHFGLHLFVVRVEVVA